MLCEVGNHPFELTAEDRAAYAKFGFEPLPVCFPHQHQWRLTFRNDRFLHRRTCDLTGAPIISMYPLDAPYKVYEREVWFSDKWDPLTYGRPFDFSRTFTDQYADLQREVPRMGLGNVNPSNSDYCNMCVGNKNSYLIFGGDNNEDSMYGALPMFCKDCVDCDWTDHCELCYLCVNLERCYRCRFTFNSKDCADCLYTEDCIGCNECILSFNLRNKSYYIENKPYSKEEYFKKKQEYLTGSHSRQNALWERFLKLRKNRMVKYAHIINGENVSGDYIVEAKNCTQCFEVMRAEDCHEIYVGLDIKDSANSDYVGHKSVRNFNNISCFTSYNNIASYFTVDSSDIEYCEASMNSKNLFGCIGLRHQQYCILNKKYSKEEFEKTRAQIIEHMKKTGEWGKFLAKELSCFPYNQSTASFFFPLKKEEALAQGFKWTDEEETITPVNYTIPDHIDEVPDTITNEILTCEVTGKNFRIIPQELNFYRKHLIPIPRRHPDQRYRDRLALRNPFTLYKRTCQKCEQPVETTYPPDRTEQLYCENCYLKNIY